MSNNSESEASTPTSGSSRKKVFVVSPIGAPGSEPYRKAAYALKYIFRVALPEDEWNVHRADEGTGPDSIGQHVIRKIWEADLVIADLTGHNPNVFYELAIAHGWKKPVVHLISSSETMPFDIVDQRAIFYDITDLESVEQATKKLARYAEYALNHSDELITPLSGFERFSQIRSDGADGGEAVVEVLEEIVSRLSRLEQRFTRADSTGYPNRYLDADLATREYIRILEENMARKEAADPEEHAAIDAQTQSRLKNLLSKLSPKMRSEVMHRAERRLEQRMQTENA